MIISGDIIKRKNIINAPGRYQATAHSTNSAGPGWTRPLANGSCGLMVDCLSSRLFACCCLAICEKLGSSSPSLGGNGALCRSGLG